MAASIQVQATTGSNFPVFIGAILAAPASATPNGIPATRIDVVGLNGDTLRVIGTGLTLNLAGVITGGTVTGLTLLDNGASYVKFTGFSILAVDFYAAITGPNPQDVLDLIGDIKFEGNDGIDVGLGANGNDDLRGGLADDNLQAFDGNDVVDGGDGGDFMRGGADIDTLTYERSAAGVTVNLASGKSSGGDATGDNFAQFENLRGSDHKDNLSGNGLANVLEGRGGNDTLRGSGGADTLNGGTETDTIDYLNSTAGVTINLAAGTASGGHATGDSFSSIENVRGSNSADTLTGDTDENTLYGQDGDDTLNGGAGRDRLFGGAGNDRLDGGSGAGKRTGGAGDDTFVLHKLGSIGSRIIDFTPGSDILEVSAVEFGGGLDAVAGLGTDQFLANDTGFAAGNEDRFILNNLTGELWFDRNGAVDGATGARLVATFDLPTPALGASDFDIV